MLRFQLLGPLEVRDGEQALGVRRRKQRALLAILALRSGEAISPDRLVEDIWGDRPPKTARHALENYVSELRRTLGRDVIRTDPAGYVLAVEPDQVDARRLERLLDRVEETSADRAGRLRAELSLIRGQPLEDLAFEPFAQAAVPRLLELELTAREELAGLELELGRHADVLVTLEALVAAHPYREHLRALLMLALYRSGRQADALAAYQDARRVLVEELGIDPGEELQEMERAILRQDATLRAPPRVTARLAAIRDALPIRPTRKTVTVVVANIRNAAALATSLEPEMLRALLDRFADVVRSSAERHGGVARITMGRALAVFGVPTTHEDDALRAVRAANEIREGVGVLNDGLLPEHGVFLEVSTALDTGEVLVTAEELATGRPVSAAEELERATRSGQILLGESTRALVAGAVDAVPERGSYRLVGLREGSSARELRLDSPLVGRRRQLAALSSAFEGAVTHNNLCLVTVLGVAGTGKSRLVGEFLETVGDVASVLRGQCLPYGEAITYGPLSAVAATSDAEETPTVSSVRDALEGLARTQPVVFVLEDLHWAEPALLDLVDDVAATSEGAPILVLCAARPELLEARGSWGRGNACSTTVVLDSLTEAESERLVDNLLGDSDLPDAVRDYVIETSEGIPLYVEELLALLVDREILERRDGRWTTTQVPVIPVPGTIHALVASRIDRLPEEERVALELASVEGKVFSPSTLVLLSPDAPTGDVDALLAALVRKEFVRRQPSDDVLYAFRHQLIRDAAYESLPLPVRAELHERLADELARQGGEGEKLADYHRDRVRRYREALGTP